MSPFINEGSTGDEAGSCTPKVPLVASPAAPGLFGWPNTNARGYQINEQPMGTGKPIRIIVLGAGASGINFLKTAKDKLRDVELVCYEKNGDIGGTWLENTYPGVACDIPSVSYQFTWQPHIWPEYYSSGNEIWMYLRGIVDHTSALFGAMTMHVIRGPASDHQLGLCMVAMRVLATMYTNAEWVRNIFQKLGDKKRSIGQNIPTAPTRAVSPARQMEDHFVNTPPVPSYDTSALKIIDGDVTEPTKGFGISGLGDTDALDHMKVPNDLTEWVEPSTEAGISLGLPGGDISIYPQFQIETSRQGYQDQGLVNCWDDLFCSDVSFDNPFILQ